MTAPASSWSSSSRPGVRPTKPPWRAAGGCRRSCSRDAAVLMPSGEVAAERAQVVADAAAGWSSSMPMNAVYRGPADLPEDDSGVPAAGRAAAAARPNAAQYLRAALSGNGRRCAARRPPADRHDPARSGASRPDEDKPNLFRVGCVGRITQFAESGDGRYLLQLTGVARFRVVEELAVATAYRQCRVDLPAIRRRFHRPQGRGRGRPQGAARALTRLSQGQQSQGRLGRHRERAQRGAGQCARHDVALRPRREAGDARSARPQDPRRNPGRRHRDRARQEQHRGRDAAAMMHLSPRD